MTTRNPFAPGSTGDGLARPDGENGDISAPDGAGPQDVGGAGGRLRVAPDPERDLACCRLPLTDLGNAERWRVRFGQDFRFCAEIGWFAWDGRRWKLLSEERDRLPARVMQSVFLTVRAIRNEAALVAASGCEPPAYFTSPSREALFHMLTRAAVNKGQDKYLRGDDSGARGRWLADQKRLDFVVNLKDEKLWSTVLFAWAKTSEGAGKLDAVAKLAKSFADIAIEPDALDADRMAINVLNGTLRLVRRKVKRSEEEVAAGKSVWKVDGWQVKREPHRREDLITKLAPVKYLPNAACPAYDGFIERVQTDGAMRRFIHQWGGLSLTGDTGEQKLAFFYGSGSNGKGTWVELVAHIAGDYAGSIPIESFLDNGSKRRGDQATPDIARLPGVRFLRVSEPEKGSALNEGLIKMVTGQDPVDARHLNKGFFTFLPSFKMTISGNHKPKVKDTSDGIWRRMQLVPWEVNIPREERDQKLGEKLRAEASGVLNRLIEGLLDWHENGLIEPEQVRLATSAYRDESDDLGRFLTAICEVGVTCRCGARELFDLYEAWAEAAGGSQWKIKGFKGAMIDKGFEQKQSDGMKWIGVQPRPGVNLEDVKRGVWPGVAADSNPAVRGDFDDDWGDPPPGWEGG